jgi:sugar phosphate isomerase/epimerase
MPHPDPSPGVGGASQKSTFSQTYQFSKSMELGLSTYTYTWAFGVPGHIPPASMTLNQLIDKANSFDLKVIQIADNSPLHLLSATDLETLSNYANRNNIRLETGTRGLNFEKVKTYLSIAKILKSDILRIVIDEQGYEPELNEVIKVLKSIIPLLKESGVRLAIENHDRFKSAEFVLMISETDHEFIGICLDSVNSLGAAEGIDEVIKNLAPFTINLHLKEFSIKRVSHKMGFVIEGLPAGQGMLNIPSLLQAIEKAGKCRSAILELWTPPADSIEETIRREDDWANQSVYFLKDLFKE